VWVSARRAENDFRIKGDNGLNVTTSRGKLVILSKLTVYTYMGSITGFDSQG
jgi:hypothetical protein